MTTALRRLKRRIDYAEHGGAPLLGVDGVALICHGGSNAKAIKNAILRGAPLRADRPRQGADRRRSRSTASCGSRCWARRPRRREALRERQIMIGCRIIGTGRGVPARVVTNDDLSKMVDTSDAWIVERTGIRERHILEPELAASDLATAAARNACRDGRRRSGDRRLHHRRHGDARLPVPVDGDLRAAEAGRGGRAAARSTCRRRAPASSTACRSATRSSGAASSSACWSSASRCSRASSTGPTAAPACCSATAPARCCWRRTTRPERGILSTHLYADGNFTDVLLPAGGRQPRAAVGRDCRGQAPLREDERPRGLQARGAQHGGGVEGGAGGQRPAAGRRRPGWSRTRRTSASSRACPSASASPHRALLSSTSIATGTRRRRRCRPRSTRRVEMRQDQDGRSAARCRRSAAGWPGPRRRCAGERTGQQRDAARACARFCSPARARRRSAWARRSPRLPGRRAPSSTRPTRRSASRCRGSASRGPRRELTLTANAQPAILTTSIAALRVLAERDGPARRPWSPAIRWASTRRWSRPGALRARRRGAPGAPARQVHAGGGAAGRGRDGGDPRARRAPTSRRRAPRRATGDGEVVSAPPTSTAAGQSSSPGTRARSSARARPRRRAAPSGPCRWR